MASDDVNIYALRGDDRKNFWIFTPNDNSWTSLPNTPKDVDSGGGLTFLNGTIYAVRGDGKKEFWDY